MFRKDLGLVALLLLLTACATSGAKPAQPKLYFGQPVAAYNSQTVERLMPVIQKQFPGWHIENPNQSKHDQGYQRWKVKTGTGMDYYYNEVFPTMNGGIFLPFPDGAWSAGAYNEALNIEGRGNPIWEVTSDGAIKQTTTEKMRLWGGGILSVQQTRERNKVPYDEWLRRFKEKK
ncbi:MAG: hypothetical protein HYW91_02145 [Candidatus Sungbacteria bacterium]|nr:hypothetical protein [Candidatus Sungbacteria bacterium]